MSANMGWVKLQPRFTLTGKDSITLGTHILHIGVKAYERLGKPEKVDLFYDLERKAIKLARNETGRVVTRTNKGRYPAISCRLVTVGMPKGVYLPVENEHDVFVYEG